MLILFELCLYGHGIQPSAVVDRPQDVNSWTINPLGIQSTIPSLVRRTPLNLWVGLSRASPFSPLLRLDISVCPEVMMRSNNGREGRREGWREDEDGIAGVSELIERAESAALHGGFKPSAGWAKM